MAIGSGTLVLLGGGDVGDVTIGAELLRLAGGRRVAVLPTAHAFEHPEGAMVAIASWLGAEGAEVEGVMAMTRGDAEIAELAARLDEADLIYVTDGAALHLRSVLKGTVLLSRLEAALGRGAVVAASGAAATVLCDPMVDPRGGAPTVGLGVLEGVIVVPHAGADADDPHQDKLQRTVGLASAEHPVVAIPPAAGVILQAGSAARVVGTGEVVVYRGGQRLAEGLAALA